MQRVVQFAARRHTLIADNVANLSTPGFRPVDVSLDEFEAALGEAVEARRSRGQARFGALEVASTSTVQFEGEAFGCDRSPWQTTSCSTTETTAAWNGSCRTSWRTS